MGSTSGQLCCGAATLVLLACQVDDRPITPVASDPSGGGPGNINAATTTNTSGGGSGGGSTTSAGGSAAVNTASNSTSAGGSGAGGSAAGGSSTDSGSTNGSGAGGSAGGTTSTTGNSDGGRSSTTDSAASTTGAEPCRPSAAATAPVALAPRDGWVSCDSNPIGIQGAFFTYHDSGGSTIMPENFETAGKDICVSGEVAQVLDADYMTYFGAGVGFNLHQEPEDYDVLTWNATAANISGFSFTLSDMPEGTLVRFQIQSAGSDYCVNLSSAGSYTLSITDALSECWDDIGDTPDPTTIEAIKWIVVTNEDAAYPFDFCISDVEAVP